MQLVRPDPNFRLYLSYSLNSLNGGYTGHYIGTIIGLLQGILGV